MMNQNTILCVTIGLLLLTTQCGSQTLSKRQSDAYAIKNGKSRSVVPAPPKNGKSYCNRFYRELKCTAECNPNFHFPDKTTQKQVISINGIFKPFHKFPDCIPMFNNCPIPATPKQGKISCKKTADEMHCTASCKEGFTFPDGRDMKKISCIGGVFIPYTKFPDCQSSTHTHNSWPSKDIIFPEQGPGRSIGDCLTPSNARLDCVGSKPNLKCAAICLVGYQFPDGSTVKEVNCISSYSLQELQYRNFPGCQPICNPPCQNGGICMAGNNCACSGDFWGKRCATPKSICNLKALTNAGYHCTLQHEKKICVLTCPNSMIFEFPPAQNYECSPFGQWYPNRIPRCVRRRYSNKRY